MPAFLWEGSPIPYNGSGQFSAPSLPGSFNPAISGQQATPADFNTLLNDLTVNGLSNVICKDGQTTITANIPFAGFKLTGLGSATLGTDAPNAAQVQNDMTYAADTGTADLYAIAPAPPITAYHVGQQFSFLVAHTNLTTTPTLAVSGLTAGTIVNAAGGALVASALLINTVASVIVSAVSVGTPTFELQSVANGYVGGAGTINNLAWFAATGRTISSLATANSGILVTSAGGVPSIGTDIPNGVTATTQAANDASTKVATTAYANTAATAAAAARILATAFATVAATTVTLHTGSVNITSIVRNSTGRYTVTMASAAGNAFYKVALTIGGAAVNQYGGEDPNSARTTTTFDFYVNADSGGAADPDVISLMVFA